MLLDPCSSLPRAFQTVACGTLNTVVIIWKALEVGAAVSWPGRGEPRRWTSQEAAPGTETGRHREQRPHHQQMRRVNLAPALTCRVATAALLNV